MRTSKKPTPFGLAIRVRLAEKNMDQAELAAALGISRAYLTHIIYGNAKGTKWVERICEELNMPVKARWKKGA